ncbi:mannitol dehydrogenase family protein [Alginatibacterium sediminis]|uniref:Mannitol dehydrogenase family protein n=1 Tax=Alginatibacterium sediminis TaxID=2164068 RepID=A0A420EB77_9ALTE|nr:mannitol dehydrogenase family protein [Alginatibacterium sediminis]RKF17949.1 mannitol dehydrogenase family protein [Alginatibacterium sediminis]
MTITQLDEADQSASIIRTQYPRHELVSKIVHIGFGAFHRAHQAVFTDLCNQASKEYWGIFAVNMYGFDDLMQQFSAQNHLLTVTEKGAEQTQTRLVRCFTGSLHTQHDGIEAAIAKIAEPQVSIVSLTITEKGYCSNHHDGLNLDHPLIAADLKNPSSPQSAIGLISQALARRKQLGLPPISIMSCDNIPENGDLTRLAVTNFARAIDSELADWIDAKVSFPNTMVDRIVPAMTDESFTQIESLISMPDPCGVISEDFRQWVVEDNFVAGRPDWNFAGAMLVKNVLPYEEMKLRMLNGSHSFLAYNGSLCGHQYIFECMQDSELRQLTLKLMLDEQAKSLSSELDVDLEQYAQTLISRFSNTNIKHMTAQIACDGSQKLSQRAVDPCLRLNQLGIQSTILPLLIAGWMHYVQGKHTANFKLVDPMAAEIEAKISSAQTSKDIVNNLLSLSAIFKPEFANNVAITSSIHRHYQDIDSNGMSALLHQLNKQ